MKFKFLFLLLVVFALHSCTSEDIEPIIDNAAIEEPNSDGKSSTPLNWQTQYRDIHYNPNLSIIEINNTRAYYFRKYHANHGLNRLSMYNNLPFETHHEVWLESYSFIRPNPDPVDLEGELEDDDRLEM